MTGGLLCIDHTTGKPIDLGPHAHIDGTAVVAPGGRRWAIRQIVVREIRPPTRACVYGACPVCGQRTRFARVDFSNYPGQRALVAVCSHSERGPA